ncbi:MAG: molybdopterin-guanine dinucleotide biosynthesis protein MobB [Dehalococcoidales bacterium]|nr:molybdopterin-guanine dinucleotide biosynthesis protein MobB [Dehalococcoidales bacterium]
MQPIVSIVGRSDSGKTTLLEGLIAELNRRGRRVIVMKHSSEKLNLIR